MADEHEQRAQDAAAEGRGRGQHRPVSQVGVRGLYCCGARGTYVTPDQ